jgi:hypothetical protein
MSHGRDDEADSVVASSDELARIAQEAAGTGPAAFDPHRTPTPVRRDVAAALAAREAELISGL